MGILKVVVVSGTVQIGGHDRKVLRPILTVIGPTHFDTGYFGDRVRPISWLQRAGKQVSFLHRLRTLSRINAGRAEKKKPLYTGTPALVDNIILNGQILSDELRRIRVVGMNAANLGRRNENILRPLFFKKTSHSRLIGKIKITMGTGNDICKPLTLQASHKS